MPNAWYLGYRTGARETYRHVYGVVRNADMTMTLNSYNYPGVYITEHSNNYQSTDSWLLETARQYVSASMLYIETPW